MMTCVQDDFGRQQMTLVAGFIGVFMWRYSRIPCVAAAVHNQNSLHISINSACISINMCTLTGEMGVALTPQHVHAMKIISIVAGQLAWHLSG